nr:beta-ketoacyl synthase N-terminal-like domain-containing protein [uncultured Sphingomonas sp.]
MSREIAIVGMACRAPDAGTYQDFWNRLMRGECATGDWPEERRRFSRLWSASSAFSGVETSNLLRAMKGGYLAGVDQFDARLFGISPREARLMDPQHRLLLEETWQALLDAAIDPRTLEGSRTGVYFGICSYDYGMIGHEMPDRVGPYSALGAAHCIASNHVSFTLGLQGPSITVDAACAASAMAIHLAVQALQSGDCDMAIAGGINLVLSPVVNASFEMAHMLSSQGRCATFDAEADGYVRGEGVGVLVLKRLKDAAQDPVHAVIAATASNQDGRTSSITVPSGQAQVALLTDCYSKAGITPEALTFVEAHGTGTPVGDPIEAEALARVFQGRETPCLVGSLKANFGHAEAAAGALSTIKAALALGRGCLPPHVGATRAIEPFARPDAAIAMPLAPVPIGGTDAVCYAGVSAFGFGGTNVHIALRALDSGWHAEPPPAPPAGSDDSLLVLSAHSMEALADLRARWQAYLLDIDQQDFEYVRAMTRRGFGGGRFRIEIAAATPSAAAAMLDDAPILDAKSVGERTCSGGSVRFRPSRPPPGYSFVRKRFWAYDYLDEEDAPANAPAIEATIFPAELPLDFSAGYIANHRIAGTVVVPGATIMMTVRSALLPYSNGDDLEIRDMRFRTAMIIDRDVPVDGSAAMLRLQEEDAGVYRFALHRRADDIVYADGLVVRKGR